MEIHGKLEAAIECGSRKFQHRIYVADITDPYILGSPRSFWKFRYALTDSPSQVSQKVVLVAATLVDLKREAIPVRVLNLGNKPKTVDEGAVIATCEPVVDIVDRSQEFSELLRLPSTLKNLERLNEEKRTAVKELLQEFQNLFSAGDSDVGSSNMTEHRINTGNHPPIKQYPRRLPLAKKDEAERLVKEMGGNGIIEESSRPWALPIVLVKKKDGSTRLCVDYRKLIEITIKDSYPLPRLDDTLHSLNGSQWFSTLDLKSGYWQVEIQPEDKEKTAFTTGQGLWQFKVMPFGLRNAPSTFERLMKTVLRGITEPEGQIARWIQRLQEYDFEIKHRKGTSHGNADSFSRRPCKESCKHCTNAEKTFGMETGISAKVLTTEDPWFSSEIQKSQLQDPAIRPILENKVNSEDRPSWQEIAPESPATKRY
ncbi:Retrovirus-related Pol polyprotein from transposon 297 [Araneus ventricosus]|uniref:Retrovirus-related Pol polyprotein from transposon 297 n=1 Tax=Araneus ventricosus TaxID=182803 RepID=A0A4Y2JYI2_ARAVE|nr:Retrovirus-related Pol polyprotein from transposon 297 [Araneus ventricosus]